MGHPTDVHKLRLHKNVQIPHNFKMERLGLHIVVVSKSYIEMLDEKRVPPKATDEETCPFMVFAFWICI